MRLVCLISTTLEHKEPEEESDPHAAGPSPALPSFDSGWVGKNEK